MLQAYSREMIGDRPLSSPSFICIFSCSMLILLFYLSQFTPLHCSVSNGHLEITRLLLQCNADIEAKAEV
jgi:hypothetical protein